MNSRKAFDAPALNTFLDSLFVMHKPLVTANKIEEYKASMMEKIMESINMRLVQLLTDTQQKELEVLLNRDAPDDELNMFFETNIPTVSAEVAAVLDEFKTGYSASFSSTPPASTSGISSLASLPPLNPAPVPPT